MNITTLETDEELDALKHLLSRSFGIPAARWASFFARIPRQNVRVARANGEIIGSLAMYNFGHFFGGQRVAAAGIAGVGVEAEHRGNGAARAVLRAALREIHTAGIPLASLFASTQYLYRSVGFELAAHHICYRAPASSFRPGVAADLPTRRLGAPCRADVESVYAAVAPSQPGHIDRDAAMWDRRFAPPFSGDDVLGYVFGPMGAPEGYVIYSFDRKSLREVDLVVRDLAWTTPRAARALLGFFYDQRAIMNDVLWPGPPNEPLLLLMAEETAEVEYATALLLRIAHLPIALAGRGYSADGEVHLAVTDDIIEANAGKWTLRVERGHPHVDRGGRGDLALDIRALASLYSGMYSATQLELVGDVTGPPEAIQVANRLFVSTPPWIAETF